MADTDDPKEFPDGEYELTTKNNSKIKIRIKNGEIKDFLLLSSEKILKNMKKTYQIIIAK